MAIIFASLGWGSDVFVQQFTVFVLSCLSFGNVQMYLIHYLPLMSVTTHIRNHYSWRNATVVDWTNSTTSSGSLAAILGIIAILFAAINVAGGFLVTQRMLAMFNEVIHNDEKLLSVY